MKKYTTETTNRTLTFYKKDLDTLQQHADFRNSVTDMIQEAIKDYIMAHGWDKGPANPEAHPNTIPGLMDDRQNNKAGEEDGQ